MSYGSSYTRRTGNYRRRPYSFGRSASKSRRLSSRVKRIINRRSETKHDVLPMSNVFTSSSGAGFIYFPADNIIIGTGSTDRIGNQVTVKRITYRFRVQVPTVATGSTSRYIFRIIIAMPIGTTLVAPLSELNFANVGIDGLPDPSRYRLMYNKIFVLGSNTNTGELTQRAFNISLKMDTTWTFPVNKQPLMAIYCNSGDALSSPGVAGTIQTDFKDL